MSLGKLLKDTIHLQTSDLLVTPKITKFLQDNPGGLTLNRARTSLSADSKRLVSYIMDKGFAGNEDRSGRFGASSRGTCLRAQVWTYLGMPSRKVQDVELSNLFNDGKYRHLRWQVMGMQSGALTDVELGISDPSFRVTTSLDGVNDKEGFLFELKGDRRPTRMMDKVGAVDEKHRLQIHTMFLVSGYNRASYIVEDKLSQVWREVVVDEDKAIMRQVVEELDTLNEHVEQRQMPEPLAACKVKEGPYKSCPFAAPCIKRWNQQNDYFPDSPPDWES